MKKGGILILLLALSLVLTSSLILADEQEHVDLAYSCLEAQVAQKTCASLTFEEKVFSLLAIKECQQALQSDMNQNLCWPKPNCNVKSTAQAVFALDDRGVDTTASKNWLLTQTMSTGDLQWFLEIDTASPSLCEVEYRGPAYKFSIDSNRKISANAGPCLTRVQPTNYWFQISPSCYNVEFHVSCDKPFLTTLLFKKPNSPTINVLDETHTSGPFGNATEIVNALCFKNGNSCDYEGSLWATFALWSQGEDVSKFFPYIIAMKEGNERFLPESFLYFMTGKFKTDLLSKQKQSSYWEVGSGSRYYDTALALWPFLYEEPIEKQDSKDWLLNIQPQSGCWNSNNIRDTAFILRSLWPDSAPECKVDSDCPDYPYQKCENKVCVDIYLPPGGEAECGNNIRETGEQCDGNDFDGESCSSVFDSNWEGYLDCYASGTTNECTLDTSGCFQSPECDDDEDCDGDDFCNDEGFCQDPDVNGPVCGNNIKEDGEACDGNKFGGETCESMIGAGWAGSLYCDDYCVVDTYGCYDTSGGNGGGGGGGGGGSGGGDGGGSGGGTEGCIFNFECLGNQICEGGVCVDPPITPPECTSDSDCVGDQICDDGDCVEPEYECTFDFDCPGNKICEDRECVDPPDQGCNSDLECPNDEVCIGGLCAPGSECTFDFDCPGDEICDKGECVNPPTQKCTSDLDCPGNEICVSNLCVSPPAECVFDEDCSEDEICDDNECVNPPTECIFDFQCPGDKICEDNKCVFPPGEGCTFDLDCPGDEICENGNCLLPTECSGDIDCPGQKICINNSCVSPPGDCLFDIDCPGDKICEDGQCIDSSYECISDTDCYGTEVCINWSCVEPESECNHDWDCPGDQECVAGNCISPGNGSIEYCVTNDDCTQGRTCIEGICSDNDIFDCEGSGYFCMSSIDCEGSILSSYSDSCFSPFICCNEPKPLETCNSQLGEICLSTQDCIGGVEADASDLEEGETCCTGGGYCIEKGEGGTDNQNIGCENYGGACRNLGCLDSEKESYEYACNYGDTCCMEKKKSKTGIVLLFIFLFLILLVVLGFIFRDKLKEYWIKMKSKFGKKKSPLKRPGFSMHGPGHPHPGSPMRPMHPVSVGAQKKPPFFRRIFPFKKPSSAPASQTPLQQEQQKQAPFSSGVKTPEKNISIFSQKPEEIKKPEETKDIQKKKVELKKPGESKKPVSRVRKELEEVLKKLKEMAK
jgi:hypothetical protein